MNLTELTLTELCTALRQGETSSVAATQAMLDRIVEQDNEIKSYLTITDEMALEQAAAADQRIANGEESSPPKACRQRLAAKSWKALYPPTMRSSSKNCAKPEPSSWAKPTPTSSQWGHQRKIPATSRHTTPGI